jgi:penicillin-binding protein 1A
MLAGLVVAPSSLAPSRNLRGAQRRAALVISTMVEIGALSQQQADRIAPARVIRQQRRLASGSYFSDWVRDEARGRAEAGYGELYVETTLNRRLQAIAERTVARERLPGTEVALVAMRPDGRVVAMVGGRDYATSAFNRATQARRQAGSTFKLFVYAAAVRRGYDSGSDLSGERITIGTWSPRNMDGRYPDSISLRDAFATSNNTAAVRLSEEVGRQNVIQAARDLGITSDLPQGPSLALGSGEVSLLELTSAYASVALGAYPVRPRGLERASWDPAAQRPIPAAQLEELRGLLQSVISRGSGRSAALPIAAFGKTGTTQNNRDAWFVGYASNLVVGVWIGRDNEQPMEGMTGSGVPARIWQRFMQEGLRLHEGEVR